MKKFVVYLYRTVIEEGEMDVEAENADEARKKVTGMIESKSLPDIDFDFCDVEETGIDFVDEIP